MSTLQRKYGSVDRDAALSSQDSETEISAKRLSSPVDMSDMRLHSPRTSSVASRCFSASCILRNYMA